MQNYFEEEHLKVKMITIFIVYILSISIGVLIGLVVPRFNTGDSIVFISIALCIYNLIDTIISLGIKKAMII